MVFDWFIMFMGFRTLFIIIYENFVGLFSYYYMCIMSLVLSLFIFYRVPYCYRPFMFFIFLVVVVFRRFISLFLSRILLKVNLFFCRFIPVGTPLYICPLVCLAETIRYIIRPIVLILRPFINIRLGCMGGVAIGNLSFIKVFWSILLFILFFYEVFVAIVHWYIVTRILKFSVDH